MILTEHFNLDEFTQSQTATRLNIDNIPPQGVIEHLNTLAAALEHVRTLLGGNALRISSGYRSPLLNQAVGSSATSAHVLGYAADFTCPGFGTPLEVAKKIAESPIKFDQLIQEGTWIHFSVDPRGRRELLTAHFGNGRTTYTQGIS